MEDDPTIVVLLRFGRDFSVEKVRPGLVSIQCHGCGERSVTRAVRSAYTVSRFEHEDDCPVLARIREVGLAAW
jgi:hypothetical protein